MGTITKITGDDDLAYDPRKFISILGEKWDPGCVTTPKPTGYPMAPAARTKILAGATTMAYNKCTEIVTSPTHSWTRTSSPGVGHWYVNTARERPATAPYTQVANNAAPDDDLKWLGSRGDCLADWDTALYIHTQLAYSILFVVVGPVLLHLPCLMNTAGTA